MLQLDLFVLRKDENLLLDFERERTARRNNSRRRRENRKKEAREASLSSSSNTLSTLSSSGLEDKKMTGNQDEVQDRGRRTLENYASVSIPSTFNSIARLVVNAANMEIKPALIHLVQSNQFNGLSHENPYTHLANFLEICNTVKILHVSNEAIRLSHFPCSLAGNSKL